MDKQIQKITEYLDQNLGRTQEQILKEWGRPAKNYQDKALLYSKSYHLFCKDEIMFFVEDGYVVDVAITEYFLWIGLRNIFFFENQTPEYRVVKINNFFRQFFGIE